ncbi:MAG: glycoside hydrolase family 43 protein [Lachnospiraceae bacterium]|jgi:xylan 1,4-beta-xylosidase|nr:glycoside hydrolase family 43 protein [Lachnospiraceae bacterium]
MKYRNPIISGYNPDPSICRTGNDFYIVNSSFEYFPGVPVYHSRNLVNWELCGYCLTREEQLRLKGCKPSGGIYAPTLRYHDGWYFMTTTNTSDKGNFIIHSRKPESGWSDPAWVDQGGIDPSLFFDDDGRVYFTSTGTDDEGKTAIVMCEVDPFTGEKKSESRAVSTGCGGKFPEGPHLYKIRGRYYLMLAEGGTEFGHMETIQRADRPYGPFVPCPHNPILSHKDDMRGEICCTGHADLTEDAAGNWWMVCLGVRPCGAKERLMQHNLGRETFLAPVVWDGDGWPVVGDRGLISLDEEGPLPGIPDPVNRDFRDDFSGSSLSLHYNFLRNPEVQNYVCDAAGKRLILTGTDVTLNEPASPTWIGVRQKDFETVTTVKMTVLRERENMRAGLTAYYNDSYHYEIFLTREGGRSAICLAKHVHDIYAVTARVEADLPEGAPVWFRIVSDRDRYAFSFSTDGSSFTVLGTGLAVGLCTEGTRTMTFTGTYLAMFCERGKAAFENFSVILKAAQ